MGKIKTAKLGLLLLGTLLPLLSHAATIEHDIVPVEERIRLLQTGGYFMVMRHAATDHNQKDLDRSLEPDCSKQRNLSVQGREQMKSMRRSLLRLRIPIGQVFSSPYCRTRDTAAEVFIDYEVDPDLQFSISKEGAEAKRLADHLYQRLLNVDPGRKNTVLISHTSNIRDALGIWPKPEGVVLLIQKTGSGLVYKGMIDPGHWPDA